MRTTLEIPAELMQTAQSILGYKSKTDVVIYSLQELIRRDKIEKLSNLAGKIDIEINLDKSRKRPTKKTLKK